MRSWTLEKILLPPLTRPASCLTTLYIFSFYPQRSTAATPHPPPSLLSASFPANGGCQTGHNAKSKQITGSQPQRIHLHHGFCLFGSVNTVEEGVKKTVRCWKRVQEWSCVKRILSICKKTRQESCELSFFKTSNCSWNMFSCSSDM